MRCQTYNFSNYTVENGLSQSQILAVCQDKDGVMWFGTNGGGITKYNGSSYEYITNKDGLADNIVFSIVMDKMGRILIGTNNGLSIYDKGVFRNYTTNNGLGNDRVYTVFIDEDNRILLGTGKGLSLLTDTVCSIINIDSTLDNSYIFNIFQDKNSNLWFSTLGNGGFKYDGQNLTSFNSLNGLKNNYMYSVTEYEGKYLFFMHEGLYEFDGNRIKQIILNEVPHDATFYGCLKDNYGIVWISTDRGIIKLTENKFQLISNQNGLVNNNIWKLFQDREGCLWFASRENGISKLASQRFVMYTTTDGLSFNTIDRIFQSTDGRYWMGAKKALSIYDGKKFLNFNQNHWKLNNAVTAIAEDTLGTIYIGTSYGLLKYNGKIFERIEASEYKRGLNYIHDIFIDENQDIWLGTKFGVAKVKNGNIEGLKLEGSPENFVYKIYKDYSGIYWFCTDNGVYKYSRNQMTHLTERDGFTTKSVTSIIEDGSHNLWFATNIGLYKYSKGRFSVFAEKDGLSSNIIQSLAIDADGALWAGLPNGIDKIQINNETPVIRHYGIEDGFIGEGCILNSILVDNQNKIWFGAEKGLMVYQPQYDRKNELEPITQLKDIKLFGQETDWNLFADSIDQNNFPVDLKLDYNRNSLTFNFVGVSHTAPAKVKYKYMLKGYDKTWMPETKETEASYSNLDPGKYEFMVIANNGDGVWNKEPVTFSFIILPPFWQTWWFYCIIASILLTGVYSYVKIKTANIQIVKQSHIIEDKNLELKKAYSEIAGKNKSITDSINYAKRIQESFLSSDNSLRKCLKDYFILYKPRDIVSGDFYWCFDLPDRTLIACADSTGHGIPGAFMSLIGISLLNEISHSKKMLEPAAMLDELRRIIICALNPEQLDEGGKDGLDIALISIFKSDTDDVKIHFSGGNIALHVVSSVRGEKELLEYKGDKQPVGFYSNMKPFTQREISARKGDVIYMFTDGYADQFGGTHGKKIMSKQLKKTLLAISGLPMQDQNKKLESTFSDWRGELEQVDDVTVIGIKIG